MNELQGIIDAIEYMSKISYNEKATNFEEYIYLTTDNLELNLEFEPGLRRGWFMVLGEKYHYYNEFKPYSKITLPTKRL